jgi:hypothetical protein
MTKKNLLMLLVFSVVICALQLLPRGNGQTRSNQGSSYGILPPSAYLTDRDTGLERELNRLKEARAGMGINHPRLADVERRIKELETEIATFRAIPNPFTELDEQGVSPEEIVDQLSEKELRVLVIRLAVDVKDLRKRVAALERFNPSR